MFRRDSAESFSRDTSTILLIGEISAGKTTLINYFDNYFNNGSPNNLKSATPSKNFLTSTETNRRHEFNINNDGQSKTDNCTFYRINDRATNKQYVFIDTPGISNGHDGQQNEINMAKIIETLTKLNNLTLIILVIDGSIRRTTSNFPEVVNALKSNIPDDFLKHIIVILTNTKKHQSSLDLRLLQLPGMVYPFYMQNDAFVSTCRAWTKSINDEIQYDWNRSMKQIKNIIDIIDSFQPVSTNCFIRMKEICNVLKSIMHQVHLEIHQMKKLDDIFNQANLESEQDNFQNLNIETIEQIDARFPNTLCTNCNQVCYNNCLFNERNGTDTQLFSSCLNMEDGNCQTCENHCSYMYHYNAKKSIQRISLNEHDFLTYLKSKYDQSNKQGNDSEEKTISISEIQELFRRTLNRTYNEIKNKCRELYSICSSFNLIQEIDCFIKLGQIEFNLSEDMETTSIIKNFIKKLTKLARSFDKKRHLDGQVNSCMHIADGDEHIQTRSEMDVNRLKTSDLINLYNSTNDHGLVRSIPNELHQRAIGNSPEPLSKAEEIMTMRRYFDIYNTKTISELSYSYHRLQQKIQNVIGKNIFNLRNINPELILENFTVKTLLNEKDAETSPNKDTSVQTSLPIVINNPQAIFSTSPLRCLNTDHIPTPTPYSNNLLPYPTKEVIPTPTVSSNNLLSYPKSVLRPSSMTTQNNLPLQLNKPVLESPMKPSNTQPPYPTIESRSTVVKTLNYPLNQLGFSHLTLPPPYPVVDDPSIMPLLPSDYSQIIDLPKTQSSLSLPSETCRHNPLHTAANISSSSHRDLMPTPVSLNNIQQSSTFRNVNANRPSNTTLENSFLMAAPSTKSPTIPDVVPNSEDSFDSTKILP